MKKPQVSKIFSILQQANPNPTTELVYKNDFELLIAVILSAQATDISVNLATKTLFKQAPTPKKMLALTEEGLKQHIKSIGLFNSKAKNIMATCKLLVAEHAGKVPETREELEKLPGVGRKTANVILNTAFGYATIAVDTHIFRVSKRLGLATGNTPIAVEKELMEIIPEKFQRNAHHWLILHGRYVCTARKPKCSECTIMKLCNYTEKTIK